MPRKKKASADAGMTESAMQPEVAGLERAVTEPGDDVLKPRRKAATKPAAKSAPKKRTGKTIGKKTAELDAQLPVEAGIAAAADPGPSHAGEPEVKAHIADTFGEASEANDEHETPDAVAAGDAAADADPEKEPQGAPSGAPGGWSGEDDELAGDWESGSGDEEDEERPEPQPSRQERLQKILAAAGIASRRHAEELIAEGRVQVNGQVVTTPGSKADPARDHIRVDGKLIHGAERLRYFMLNKPRGHVTTVSDPEGRPTVMQFFSRMSERLYPVGRLDYQSEGLLLMTNDGELANKLTRAASGVEKVYLVKVSGQPDENQIRALREGVRIDRERPGEGRVQTAPARIRQIRQGENPWFEVGLIEGRNRELRKMFEEIGHHVEKIRRVGYGPLELDVEPGKMRELTPDEVQALRLAAEGKLRPKRTRAANMLPREAGRSVDLEAGKRRGMPAGSGRENRREGARQGPRERRPERGFEKGREHGGERGLAREDRGGFKPRGEWRGQGQDLRQGPRPGSRPQRRWDQRPGQGQGQWQDRRQDQRGGRREDRPQRGAQEERGRGDGERPAQRPPREQRGFGDRPQRPFRERPSFGGKPQRPQGERREFSGRPQRPERPERPERSGNERQSYGRGAGRGFVRPPQGERGEGRGQTEGETRERRSFGGRPQSGGAAPGGGFGARRPGSGPRREGGQRSAGRPGGGPRFGGGSGSGDQRGRSGPRSGGPRGRGPGKPGFGKRRPS